MENKLLLQVNNASVRVEDKEILHHVNLCLGAGETHVLMGPNGTGKSTLGYTLAGNPRYEVTEGTITFKGKDITHEAPDVRARDGLFLSFQSPLEIPGITVSAFIRSALEQRTGKRVSLWNFKKELKAAMAVLQMDESYAERDLNVGFSGGEKKKAEMLQLLMLKPDLAILDETDSGLDVDAVRIVSDGISKFQKQHGGALLIITHSNRLLERIHVDKAHVMYGGTLVDSGDASLVQRINEEGFAAYESSKG